MSLLHCWHRLVFRVRARNRHGVHSPFVYDFAEQVLNGGYAGTAPLPPAGSLPSWLGRMAAYYGCTALLADGKAWPLRPLSGETKSGDEVSRFHQIIVINSNGLSGGGRVPMADPERTILVLTGIRDSAASYAGWMRYCADPAVTRCIDLFDTGLLFFRSDFLVKEYFRMRY